MADDQAVERLAERLMQAGFPSTGAIDRWVALVESGRGSIAGEAAQAAVDADRILPVLLSEPELVTRLGEPTRLSVLTIDERTALAIGRAALNAMESDVSESVESRRERIVAAVWSAHPAVGPRAVAALLAAEAQERSESATPERRVGEAVTIATLDAVGRTLVYAEQQLACGAPCKVSASLVVDLCRDWLALTAEVERMAALNRHARDCGRTEVQQEVWGALAPAGCAAHDDRRGFCDPLTCDCPMGDFDTSLQFIEYVATFRAAAAELEAVKLLLREAVACLPHSGRESFTARLAAISLPATSPTPESERAQRGCSVGAPDFSNIPDGIDYGHATEGEPDA